MVVPSKNYGKRDDFDIVNFPFLDDNPLVESTFLNLVCSHVEDF